MSEVGSVGTGGNVQLHSAGQAKVDSLNNQIIGIGEQIVAKNEAITGHYQQIQSISEMIRKLMAELSDARGAEKDAKEAYNRARASGASEEQLAALRSAAESAGQGVGKLIAEIGKLQGDIRKLEGKIKKLEGDVRQLEGQK
ncbi:MAG: hypothetical protein AAFX94_08355, partial [Myxococcota bacterium]